MWPLLVHPFWNSLCFLEDLWYRARGLGDDLSPAKGLQGLVGFLPGVMKLQVFQERL